ncbi:MAG: hypothetical protein R6U96_06975 [Promethearchaeia archaeon]
MPWIGHIIYGLCFIIPLFYFTEDDENKFNYKVAFIFLANNFVGPDAAHIWVGLPFHNLLGFLIFAIPLSLFYSYLSRFSLKKKTGSKFGLRFVDEEIREVNWKNSYFLCVSGGILHKFIDQFYHWDRNITFWPGLSLQHEDLLSWGGDAYHVLDPLILIGYAIVILSIVISFYCLKKGFRETFKLFIGITSLSLIVIFTIGVEAFLGEREVGVIFHSILYVLIPLSLLLYAAKDVKDNPNKESEVPKIERGLLLKIVAFISILFALILILISTIALVQTDIIASPLASKLGEEIADIRFTIRFLGSTILFISGTLVIASIGLLFKSNICRKIAIVINIIFWMLAFPVAISLFLSENNVKALFNDKGRSEQN